MPCVLTRAATVPVAADLLAELAELDALLVRLDVLLRSGRRRTRTTPTTLSGGGDRGRGLSPRPLRPACEPAPWCGRPGTDPVAQDANAWRFTPLPGTEICFVRFLDGRADLCRSSGTRSQPCFGRALLWIKQ